MANKKASKEMVTEIEAEVVANVPVPEDFISNEELKELRTLKEGLDKRKAEVKHANRHVDAYRQALDVEVAHRRELEAAGVSHFDHEYREVTRRIAKYSTALNVFTEMNAAKGMSDYKISGRTR